MKVQCYSWVILSNYDIIIHINKSRTLWYTNNETALLFPLFKEMIKIC